MKSINFKILLVTVLILTVFTSGAVAGGFITTKSITAIYNGLKIYVDDKPLESKLDPFIYDGVTMVSLRDICSALDLNINWEEETNSVFISSTDEVKPASNYFNPNYTYWNENKPAIKIENIKVLRNVGPFYESQNKLMIASRSFSSGIAVEVNEKIEKAEVVLDLYKKFTTIEGFYGVEDQTNNSSGEYKLNFYGDDILIYQSGLIKPSMYPILLPPGKVDLRNINRLKIEVCWQGNLEDEKDVSEVRTGDYKEIIAALADFKLYRK